MAQGKQSGPGENPLPQKEGLITSCLPGWAGLIVLVLVFTALQGTGRQNWEMAAIITGVMFLVMAPIEVIQSKRFGTGIAWNPTHKSRGFFQKVLGVGITIAVLGSFYGIFPEYAGKFYDPFFSALRAYWPWLAVFFVSNAFLESIKEEKPEEDPCYKIGQAVMSLEAPNMSGQEWLNHILSWVIKLFFLPLMFVYFCNDTKFLNDAAWRNHPLDLYNMIYRWFYMIDVAFVCVGYTFANKLAGTHIRSADKTALGWTSALLCYQPFWSVISMGYIRYGQNFDRMISPSPTVQMVYCGLILAAISIYIWATIAFGSRFSNLTHRGILCTGPYKYMRHPAYVAKLTSYFLIFVPFAASSWQQFFSNMTMFALLCGVYRVRAITEERNLRSMGPEYDIYCEQVQENRKKLMGRLLS
jgi:protein-S-isoprenylcysteine O-methyltransferase Ste14